MTKYLIIPALFGTAILGFAVWEHIRLKRHSRLW